MPSNRTCKEALIPDQYCLCNRRTNVGIDSELAIEAGNALVDKLNQLLSKNLDICHKLELSLIKDAKVRLKGFRIFLRSGLLRSFFYLFSLCSKSLSLIISLPFFWILLLLSNPLKLYSKDKSVDR